MRRRATAMAVMSVLLLAACSAPSPSPAISGSPVATEQASATQPAATATPTVGPGGWVWTELVANGAAPPPRADHTWTVTPDQSTAYLFGGQAASGAALGDLWAYDLASNAWSDVSAGGPPARFGHNAAWVDGVGLVIFAGQSGADFFSDLWAYDPAADAWRQLPAGGDAPVARYGSCASVGPDGRLWISHGFTAAGQRFADTRAYDFETGAWTDETPAAERPIERCLHACWWTASGEFILYAGQTNGVTALADLWQLTPGPRPGTNAWTQLPLTGPAARNLPAASRPASGRVASTVVFGGQGLDGNYLADAWLLVDDGSAALLDAVGGPPPGRAAAELIDDEGRARLLLFGGRDADGPRNDLWELSAPNAAP